MAFLNAKMYNILSIDSASYKGRMTASFIDYMEKKSYFIAVRDKCIKERAQKRISMYELFDMISGSETGAIIASTLVIPNDDPATSADQKNKYFAPTATKFFEDNIDELYVDSKMPAWLIVVITLICITIFGFIAYKSAEVYFRNDSFTERYTELDALIRVKKKLIKNKADITEAEFEQQC